MKRRNKNAQGRTKGGRSDKQRKQRKARQDRRGRKRAHRGPRLWIAMRSHRVCERGQNGDKKDNAVERGQRGDSNIREKDAKITQVWQGRIYQSGLEVYQSICVEYAFENIKVDRKSHRDLHWSLGLPLVIRLVNGFWIIYMILCPDITSHPHPQIPHNRELGCFWYISITRSSIYA